MTAFKEYVVPDVRGVQVTPSGDVRIVPDAPTATNKFPDHVMPNKGVVVPDTAGIQLMPGVTTVKVVVPEIVPCCALMAEVHAVKMT